MGTVAKDCFPIQQEEVLDAGYKARGMRACVIADDDFPWAACFQALAVLSSIRIADLVFWQLKTRRIFVDSVWFDV